MGRVKWWGLSAVVALGAAAAVPFLVPASSFIPEVTRIAGGKLGKKVRIDELRLHLLPTPRVVAVGLEVGEGDAIVRELEIVPDLLSFLTGTRTIRLVRARDVALSRAALALPPASKTSSSGPKVQIERIALLDVKVSHPSVRIPPFDIDVRLAEGLSLAQALLETRDKALTVTLDPEGNGRTRVSLAAKQWTLPAGPPLTFDSLAAKGLITGSRIELSEIAAVLYGGTVNGGASIDWGKQWQISGKATLAGVDLVPVQQALGKPPNLSGRLQASGTFSSRAKVPAEIVDTLVVEGPFEIVGGAYQGVDLSKAGDITGKRAEGDATSFEELKGRLQLRAKRLRLEELCVRSPKVVAGGHVEVDPEQKLTGKLDVSVAKTGGFVGVPVTLGGTTADPSIRPSTGYLIGAAVGTVLLPGLGTTLGASAGSKLEGVSSSCK